MTTDVWNSFDHSDSSKLVLLYLSIQANLLLGIRNEILDTNHLYAHSISKPTTSSVQIYLHMPMPFGFDHRLHKTDKYLFLSLFISIWFQEFYEIQTGWNE